jgi:hypothetical protein
MLGTDAAKGRGTRSGDETPKGAVRLDAASVGAFAQAVADAVVSALDRRPRREYMDAREMADALKATPDWVYRHAAELGGSKMGGKLRFDHKLAIELSRIKRENKPSPRMKMS